MSPRVRAVALPTLALASLVLAGGAGVLPAQPRAPVIQQRVSLDPREPVAFHVLVVPDTVYVGQQATYEVGVFIAEAARQRMRRNPEVIPAELRGVLAYDLGGPQSLPPVTQPGLRSFPHVLQRAVFPLAPGTLVIPASRLTYALPQSTSFFSREESATLRGEEVALVVRPLPEAGRPDDFSGAVGQLALRAQVDAAGARVGDPVLLTVRVSGRGNVKLWPRPLLRADGVSLVESTERVRIDSTGQFVRGSKEFEWLLTPERAGDLTLPAVRYVYFDPEAAAYRVATSDSLRLVVAQGEFVPPPAREVAAPPLPWRRVDAGDASRPWFRHAWPWLAAALAPLGLVRRRRDRPRTARPAGRGERADAADAAGLSEAGRRHRWRADLAASLGLPLDVLRDRRDLERCLRRRGVTRETTARVLRLAADVDAAAWAPPALRRDAARRASESRLIELLGAVRAEAVPPGADPAAVGSPAPAPAASDRDAAGHTPPSGGHRAAVRTGASVLAIASLAMHLGAGRPLSAAPAVGTTLARAIAPESAGQVVPVADSLPGPPFGPSSEAFAEALAAHDAGDHAAAAAAFRALAEQSPRRLAAWINAGSAAWAQGDTAQAVRAWQRALRLDPDAADVRAQLERLASASWQGVAAVPVTSPAQLAAVALAGWLFGWTCLALGRRAPPVVVDRLPPRALHWMGATALLLAGVAGGAAWRVERLTEGATLAVVARSGPLRVAPGRDANGVGAVGTGDVVRRGRQRTVATDAAIWSAVTHADGRDGWLPDDDLVKIR